ncbi:hypothetical protein MOQ72_06700 [Saccharopolyspora sp. K220]|uniref:hypothetical protein n=1 Tax=Saccharopolyspora soli TaxID=2926618 RepID=UPI001F56E324|nr:hypothetical protein [Saccharopolyspora soli]MCI2417105.1 hypothetical protein [Saccharopolyspora soli]
MNHPGQPVVPVVAWAQRLGWRVAWNVPGEVLEQLPGAPFHKYRRKSVPILLAGRYQGMSAMAVHIDFTSKQSSAAGSYYSASTETYVSTSTTKQKVSTCGVVVLELPSPVPELVVDEKRDKLDDVSDLFSFNRSKDIFQGEAVDVGPAALHCYHVSGAPPEFVRSVVTVERTQWLYGGGLGPASNTTLGKVYFRLSGRKVIVWSGRNFEDTAVLDSLFGIAQEILRWIPPAAYQDPIAAEADRQHVPLPQLQVPFE